MTSLLTDAEVSYIIPGRVSYAELGATYRNWVPVKTIPDMENAKAYRSTRVERPAASKFGDVMASIATSYDELSANLVDLNHKIEFSRVEVAEARRSGFDPLRETAINGLRQMNRAICQLIFQGMDDPVSINGMFDFGTNVDGTSSPYSTAYWNTAPNPLTHVQNGAQSLISNGFEPPYVMTMDYGLYPGWFDLHNAASDLSHDAIAKRDYLSAVYFYEGGSDSGTKVNPLPAANSDDGVWTMFKPDARNFLLLETHPPRVNINPELDRNKNIYEGWIQWRGTVLSKRSGSVIYNEDVDLAS